ncbi:MAG: response regulator [Imperialibacter sp.]|uniref:LytR/AlgR family response regulator transcription factor n=1 Tax=Imperialibacter sp. TaxID=2038411 RepID=UPI0032EF624B
METVKVLIVEDKSVVAEDLKLCLQDYGYVTLGICSNGHDAITMADELSPDILLMDININGSIDGVETVRQITSKNTMPVIYLTAYSDSVTVDRAKATHPAAYLVKPFDPIDLKIAIDIAIENFQEYRNGEEVSGVPHSIPIINDSFFIKQGESYHKVPFSNILYVEADGSYTKIHTTQGTMTLSMNMKGVLSNLPPIFLKVHRSFIVNLRMVDKFDRNNLYVGEVAIPVSNSNKDILTEKFLKIS